MLVSRLGDRRSAGEGSIGLMTQSNVPVKSTNGTTATHAEPLALLDDFAAQLERWWSRPFSFFPGPLMRSFRATGREPLALTPATDVYEKDNVIYVKTEL